MTHAARKDQAHHLIDAITPQQLDAIVGLLEVIAPPQDRRLAAIPIEDELISDEENAASAAARGPWIPMEEVMADLRITQADLDAQRAQDEVALAR